MATAPAPTPTWPSWGVAGQTALVNADLIRHFQEVKDVHLCRRVISTGQQGMEVWDRWRNTLLIDHVIQVSVRIKGQKYRPPTGSRAFLDTAK